MSDIFDHNLDAFETQGDDEPTMMPFGSHFYMMYCKYYVRSKSKKSFQDWLVFKKFTDKENNWTSIARKYVGDLDA